MGHHLRAVFTECQYFHVPNVLVKIMQTGIFSHHFTYFVQLSRAMLFKSVKSVSTQLQKWKGENGEQCSVGYMRSILLY